MAEEDNSERLVNEALLEEQERPSGQGRQKLIRLGIFLGVVVLSAVAGNLASRLRGSTPSEVQAHVQEEQAEPELDDAMLAYHDLEPIVVNLNEPRLTRYVRATLTLATRKEDEIAARAAIEKRMPELKNWLILYLADCSLDELRGARNLNRILREIQDSFNEKLWPDSRPLIVKVDFKEWAVQ